MTSYLRKKTPGNTEWFVHDRFGMFIHFGLYAMPARHEQVMQIEKMTDQSYYRYFRHFNPDLFDAKEWARQAKVAGMKYAVLTTKHHDGFCLFETKYTDYKITNTPFGRDLVKEYVDAFRAEGIKIGFYYSLLDWHHPEYTIDYKHPRRDDLDAVQINETRDIRKYAEYMRNQVQELVTNYGKIDIMWFDFSFPNGNPSHPQFPGKGKDEWEADALIKLVRSYQPDIIIDNRTGFEQDLFTPEQYQVEEWPRHPETDELVTWETCQTFSGSWGYYRDEQTWKSPKMLLEILIKSVALGGNLLMNVGPCGRGYFDARATAALKVYGEWMKYNSRAIYGCTMAEPEFTPPAGTVLTQSSDGKRLYIHLFTYPFSLLSMKGLGTKIEYAHFLHDASEIRYTIGKPGPTYAEGIILAEDTVYFKIPPVQPEQLISVIEVFLK